MFFTYSLNNTPISRSDFLTTYYSICLPIATNSSRTFKIIKKSIKIFLLSGEENNECDFPTRA